MDLGFPDRGLIIVVNLQSETGSLQGYNPVHV